MGDCFRSWRDQKERKSDDAEKLDVPAMTMKVSAESEVRGLYEESADEYAKMMDSEIDLPVYADILGRLAKRIVDVSGRLIDTSCGPGHMLSSYHVRYDSGRSLRGIDLSPRMVEIARSRLGSSAKIMTGDMRHLGQFERDSSAAILSFFAIHHLAPNEISATLQEWHRVLRPKGQLVVAAWEGAGSIDYGDEFDVVALRYHRDEVVAWVRDAGFTVDRSTVESVEGMPMKAIYLEGTKE